VTQVELALDAACNLNVAFAVDNRPSGLEGDDHLYLQLETDGDPMTGQPEGVDPDYLTGADLLLDISATGAGIAPYQGPGFGDFGPPAPVTKVGQFGASVPLSVLPTSGGTTLRAWGQGCNFAGLFCGGDWVPDLTPMLDGRVETYELPLVFSAAPPADTTPPKLEVSGKAKQRAKKVKLRVGCDENCTAKATAKFKVKVAGGKKKTVKLKSKPVGIAAGLTRNVVAKANAKSKKALKRASGKRVKTKVKVVATDAAGNQATRTKRLKLAL